MLRFALVTLLGLVLQAGALQSNATLVTFDTRTNGTPYVGLGDSFPSAEYAPRGVTTITDSDPSAGSTNVNSVNPVPANAGHPISGYHVNVGAFSGTDPTFVEFVFGGGVGPVEFDFATALGQRVRVIAFDAADVVIYDQFLTGPDTFVDQAGFTLTSGHALVDGVGPIAKVRLEDDDDVNAGLIVDNLAFVPEPATVALLGLGLLAAGWRRRRAI